jgi:hypothetical protein
MDKRRVKTTGPLTWGYYVRKNNEANSTEYLTMTPEGRSLYKWTKDKAMAVLTTYDAAQKAAVRYGGHVVKRTVIIEDRPTG